MYLFSKNRKFALLGFRISGYFEGKFDIYIYITFFFLFGNFGDCL